MQIRQFLMILIFTLVFFSTAIFAEKKHSVLNVLHINGINTTKMQANNNMKALENAAHICSKPINWSFLYNETEGLIISDLLEALRQKNQEKAQLDIYDFVDAYMEMHHLNYPTFSPEYMKLKNKLKELYIEDLDYVGRNSEDLLQQYHEKVVEGAKSMMSYLNATDNNKHHIVLFVPHSQGALYANSLADYLIKAEDFPAKLIGIYAFASPASTFGNSDGDEDFSLVGDYMSGYNDFVIGMVNAFSSVVPGTERPLGRNIHLNICHDKFCHGLITSYLANREVMNQFMVDVNCLAGYLIAKSL